MRSRRNPVLRWLLVGALVLLTASALSAATRPFVPVQAGPQAFAEDVELFAPDRVLVKFTADAMARAELAVSPEKGARTLDARTGLASVDALLARAGATAVERPFVQPQRADKSANDRDRWFMVRTSGADVQALARDLAADPDVETASVDWRAFPAAVPSDPMYPDHWGHDNTAQLPAYDWGGTWDHTGSPVGTVGFDANAPGAWDSGYGTAGVVIAIIDSGVDVGHPDLRQVAGYDYGDNDSNPDDDSSDPGHGTACAGVAAAMRNSLGSVGVAADCSIMPLKIANSAGSMYFSAIVNAIYHAADNGADVISMSLGAAISSDASTDAALQYAYNAGVTILAATGNENASTISYPAINQYVIGVGAASPCGERKRSSSSSTEVNSGVDTDPNGYTCDGERWWGSNYGVTTQDAAGAVDVIAPTILPTTDIQGSGGYDSSDYSSFFNGTSCATPYAAGVCALIKTANPSWTPAQIRDQLVDTAQDVTGVESGAGWDRYAGYGMVDAAAAVGGGMPTPPVAEFAGSPVSGDYPLNVSFTDQSSNGPTSWSWTFGDGGTSTAQNPSHTYNATGVYTVSLTVANADGSDVETKVDYITVTEPVPTPPVAEFAGTPVSGEYPLSVQFTDASTNSPTGWSWTFGDGGTSTAQNPGHVYTAAGVYTVSLTAVNADGSDVETKVDYITVTEPAPTPPVAAFTGSPVSGTYPLDVAFVDESTNAPTSWSWTFGDGGTSTAQNPSHTYTAAGVYTVSLTAVNADGSDVETKTDYVTVTEPGVTTFVTATGETSVIGSVSGTYAATVSADDVRETVTEVLYTGHPRKTYSYLEHRWSFVLPAGGDATFHLEASRTANADGDDFVFTYSTDGATWLPLLTLASSTEQAYSVALGALSGNVTVRVVDTDRNWGLASLDAVNVDFMAFELGDVQPSAPTADFTGTPTSGEYPLVVQFTDASTGDPTSWSWTFGDGGTSTAQNPSHTFAAAGVYTVSLTATNAQGSDTATKTDYITVTEPGTGGDTMHVAAITVTRVISGRKYYGRAQVQIVDDGGSPVASATVTGLLTGDGTETLSGVTGSDGWMTVTSARKYYANSDFCFEVTGVTHASLTYDEAANAVTKACESGNVFGADTLVAAGPALACAPNPFNPMTEIAFRTTASGHVRLEIFDMRGRIVETLVDGETSEGAHSVSWSATQHPGGVYFARLQGPGVQKTLKLVLLK